MRASLVIVLALGCNGEHASARACEAARQRLASAWSRYAHAARAEAAALERMQAEDAELRRHLAELSRNAALDLGDANLAQRAELAAARDAARVRYVAVLRTAATVSDDLVHTVEHDASETSTLDPHHALEREAVREAALTLHGAEAALRLATHGAPPSHAYPGPALAAADLECTRLTAATCER